MTALLNVTDLKKTFETKKGVVTAVEDVSFVVESGKTLALVGESGCGKSTVAQTLLHLLKPDGGKVIFEGVDLANMGNKTMRKLRQNMSIVFQNPYSSLNPKMRVFKIVGEPLQTAYKIRGQALRERVEQLLCDVGLGPQHMDRYPHEFSGGQRQRIAIARALALEPKLLILDEPTAALDVSVQAQVLNLLLDLQDKTGISYLFISHDLATVEYIADEIVVMYLGRIVEQGPVPEIFSAPQHPYTKALLTAIPTIDLKKRGKLQPLTGEIPSPLNRPVGCAFQTRCPKVQDHCRKVVPVCVSNGTSRSVACFYPLSKEASQ
ncbi:ABC transporter ATP-binding protein [Geopsychrobacter electrodiphilus]|uniref:ABC transporter ATP-binding protein n=1 Tax=Geopsychrobacter electrodiphilus TaxID=225196 RepID=UPI000373BB1D|nr:oligopeptide/dipeptide ABC transporter ATP-binding protein [Geopsychrobacter electrodiphilus]